MLYRQVVIKISGNLLHIRDERMFTLKCNLGNRINQPLKSRQTETNCTPIANVLSPNDGGTQLSLAYLSKD